MNAFLLIETGKGSDASASHKQCQQGFAGAQ